MTWANIPPGDAGDLSAGSRSESCLPPRVGWRDRCLRWGGGPELRIQGLWLQQREEAGKAKLHAVPCHPEKHPALGSSVLASDNTGGGKRAGLWSQRAWIRIPGTPLRAV